MTQTKFEEFFELRAADVEPIQKRVFEAIKEATDIVDCYKKMFEYVIEGLKWHSRQKRHRLMDNNVDTSGVNAAKQKIEDVIQYFEEDELLELENAVLFENMEMAPLPPGDYGHNVFILRFDDKQNSDIPQKAYRQVQLYLRVVIYNQEYSRLKNFRIINNITEKLPNAAIISGPGHPLDPDDSNLLKMLEKYTNDLIAWMKNQVPELKEVVKATVGTNNSGVYNLIFPQGQTEPSNLTVCGIKLFLEKIRQKKDSAPSTKKAFGLWAINQITDAKNSNFWNQDKISNHYADIKKIAPLFSSSTKGNLKIYTYFWQLFADFLSLHKYEGESDADANSRRESALEKIKVIFVEFSQPSSEKKIKDKYAEIMGSALEKIQKDVTESHTEELLRAKEPIPGNAVIDRVLPVNLLQALKTKVDDFLASLPIQLKSQPNRPVRFLTIPNFEDLALLNSKSVTVDESGDSKSIVRVNQDPKEQNTLKFRPIFRTFRYDRSKINTQAFAFCNLSQLSPGTFYYWNESEPAVARLPESDEIVIDFQKYTITWDGKKTESSKNEANEPYRQNRSTLNFFSDIKDKTKWRDIKGIRRYDPYYETKPDDIKKPIPHLMGYLASGRGLNRTLTVRDNLCLWMWNYTNLFGRMQYSGLGELLGLPPSREIKPNASCSLEQLQTRNSENSDPPTIEIGGTHYSYIHHDLTVFLRGAFYFQSIIEIRSKQGNTSDSEFYIQVNTPTAFLPRILSAISGRSKASRHLENVPAATMSVFDFRYYRRITTPDDNRFSQNSKIIQLFSKGDKRKPSGNGVDLLPHWSDDEYDAVGVNLPICFNIEDNVWTYYRDKQHRQKLINKATVLYREKKPRKGAAITMKTLRDRLQIGLKEQLPENRVPASNFASVAMRNSSAVQADWNDLKSDSGNALPVDQEWCHLKGHGDGGGEYPGNFVSGSIHCNTEQLAIETGQRLVTQQEKKGTYELFTTAYLIRDADESDVISTSEVVDGNYLTGQTAYQEMLKNHTARASQELPAGGATSSTSPSQPRKKRRNQSPPEDPPEGKAAPLAAYIRYKILKKEDSKLKKYFDYLFEGQSEFIDKHQFNIISRAVQFALAGFDAFDIWYAQESQRLTAEAAASLAVDVNVEEDTTAQTLKAGREIPWR